MYPDDLFRGHPIVIGHVIQVRTELASIAYRYPDDPSLPFFSGITAGHACQCHDPRGQLVPFNTQGIEKDHEGAISRNNFQDAVDIFLHDSNIEGMDAAVDPRMDPVTQLHRQPLLAGAQDARFIVNMSGVFFSLHYLPHKHFGGRPHQISFIRSTAFDRCILAA